MTSIVFSVTAKAQSAARLNSEQVFDIERLEEFRVPETVFSRTYAGTMDGKGGRGTLVGSHDTSRLKILVSISERARLEELLHSLADYQIAEIDATDVPAIGRVLQFVMTNDKVAIERRGCTGLSTTIDIRVVG